MITLETLYNLSHCHCLRNNLFLKDGLDRVAGRQGPDVFARLKAAEKRLQVRYYRFFGASPRRPRSIVWTLYNKR